MAGLMDECAMYIPDRSSGIFSANTDTPCAARRFAIRQWRVLKPESLSLVSGDLLALPYRVRKRPQRRHGVRRRSGSRRALQEPRQIRRRHQRSQDAVRLHVEFLQQRAGELTVTGSSVATRVPVNSTAGVL